MKKNNKYIILSSVCGALLCGAFPTDGYAAAKKLRLKNSVKAQYTADINDDLETLPDKTRASETIEAKTTFYGDLNDEFSFLTQARGVINYGDGGSIDSETGESAGREDFLELRQYWLEYDGISKEIPLSVRVGRQRIRESRALWWNRDFDAVRFIYDATLLNGFIAVGQNLTEYRTSGDVFNKDDEDIFRILGQSSWQWKQDNFFEARFAYQDDHSGLNSVGSVVSADDNDGEDADLLWVGVRASGKIDAPMSNQIDSISYRADIMALNGEQDVAASTNNGNGTRTVTGHSSQDVSGWAADVGVDISLPVGRKPNISVGYAYGSGDDDLTDNDDKGFRQTGLDGNTSRMNGAIGSHYNYGSVLRPDLSNIHIITAGVNVPVLESSDLALVYHYYRLAEDATSLETSGISASLNGTDKEIGHGLDAILNTNISKELNVTQKGLDKVGLKTTVGVFKAGDAYGVADGEVAYRAQVDLSVRF